MKSDKTVVATRKSPMTLEVWPALEETGVALDVRREDRLVAQVILTRAGVLDLVGDLCERMGIEVELAAEWKAQVVSK
jgi:hypothetical protein